VAAASIATNYLAHGCWTFPYAHRSNGPLRATVDGNYFAQLAREEIPPELRQTLAQAGIDLSPQATVKRRPSGEGWVVWDLAGQDRLAIAADEQSLRVYDWDQWYEFEGSYWFSDRRSTVDRGEPDQAKYALHVLVGHHGVFSLTPLWLLSVVGVGLWLVRGEDRMRGLALLVSAITVVCLGFYLARPLQDRNYGGVACGFRWAFWLIPLWLMVLVPAADVIVRHRGARYLGLALLLVSVISASYACLNPWSQPWLYQYWAYLGLIEP
jgi:hypothetical protein